MRLPRDRHAWTIGEVTALKQTSITIRNPSNPSYPDPYQGRSPAAFAPTTPPNINITSNNLRNPSADTVNVGFSHQLVSNVAINIDGVYTRTFDFPVAVNVNTPDTVTMPRDAWAGSDSRVADR